MKKYVFRASFKRNLDKGKYKEAGWVIQQRVGLLWLRIDSCFYGTRYEAEMDIMSMIRDIPEGKIVRE